MTFLVVFAILLAPCYVFTFLVIQGVRKGWFVKWFNQLCSPGGFVYRLFYKPVPAPIELEKPDYARIAMLELGLGLEISMPEMIEVPIEAPVTQAVMGRDGRITASRPVFARGSTSKMIEEMSVSEYAAVRGMLKQGLGDVDQINEMRQRINILRDKVNDIENQIYEAKGYRYPEQDRQLDALRSAIEVEQLEHDRLLARLPFRQGGMNALE